ncbi:beta strand repeat-containing protein [Litoreibacter janthinus]|uniref:Conserved repeat domain-containing protein n=1 Tax=Litoreibacter janthinus TaxID=670154 RepID=A0A1I6ICN3_9RHOB|nr:DUF11 domain-containing protein [Litoreibacter janthinus]SFR64384.1 conserved repeat domain-containing protein [Litoreibacter janthinus]
MKAIARWLELIVHRFLISVALLSTFWAAQSQATTFTTTVPGTSITLPADYPEAGGIAIVMVGVNGNVYYQFSDPANAFVGYNNRANRDELEGNPFTVNDPIPLNCGFSSCRTYFGGDLAHVYIRFSAYDGDTQVGGFDYNDISLLVNGYNVGSWSNRTTERTNTAGNTSLGFENGFGNNVFNTGWFDSTNPAMLDSLLDTGQTSTQVLDDDPNDNYWNFQRGPSLSRPEIATVAPGYTIDKTASVPSYAQVNDPITYTYVISNIGSVAIRNLLVEDDQIDEAATPISCNKTTILPRPSNDPAGPDQATCSVTYLITQDDIDNGTLTNVAVGKGDPDEGVLGAVSDTVTVTGPTANPSIDVVKTSTLAEPGQRFGNAGTTVPYLITAENDGNVTLTNVILTDDLIPSFSCTIPEIAPGDSESCTANYTVKQSDVDDYIANNANELSNTARGSGTAARGSNPSDDDTLTIPGPLSAPDFTIAKTALTGTYAAEGDTLQYNVEITNTGNVTFPNAPTVTEALATATVNCPTGPVAPLQTVVCSVSYDVVQGDINDGQVDNEVTADITIGGVNVNKSATATVTATRTTGLTLVKRLAASSPTSFNDAGQTLSYEYVLTNTGNVTLETPTVADDVIDVAGSVSCAATEILPDQAITCTATYSTLQEDLNAGEVTNIATASAVTVGAAGGATVTSADRTLTVPAVQSPALTLAKDGAAPASFTIGENITYTFTVTNSGNVDITDPITITDDKIGTFACLPGPLARGASDTCTANYPLTLTDVANGAVTNVASASAGGVTSANATETISNSGTPAITVTKVALTDPIGATDTSVRYRFFITNTGDTQIIESVSPITISDDKINSSPFICAGRQPSVLNLGDSYDCARNYTSISQAERDAGEVVNTVSGSFPFNTGTGTIQVTSPEYVETTPITQDLSFTFAKEQDGPDTFLAVNEVIDYTFTVVNDGNVTITSVSITDTLIPNVTCPITNLAPGASDTCTAQYTVKQKDVDAGVITNVATATGTSGQGGQFTAPDATETSTLDPAGDITGLAVTKTANKAAFATVGETITYTIDVFNDGTKTLTNTTVTDILDPSYSCTIPTLAPNTSYDLCQFTYTVKQEDIDAGVIDNTASAVNAAVTDGPDEASIAILGPTRAPELEIEKTARSGYTNVGDTVVFDIRVRNTGNITATGVSVEDASIFSPAETCAVGDIAPGFDAVVCSLSYIVDQDDLDNGSVSNSATVTGTGADGTPLSETASETAQGPTANPSVNVDKVAAQPTYASATDSFDFTFTVTNTGNVTLTGLELVDVDGDGETFRCDVPDLPPAPAVNSTATCVGGAPMSFTKNFSQADVDAGSYTNTATVTGESLVGATPVTATDAETVTGPTQTLTLSIDKRETFAPATFAAVGEVITYEYDVTNTSNITVRGAITVSDSVTSLSPAVDVPVTCPATPAAGLAPNASLTCTASYTVTQEDIDNGAVTNSATASTEQRINGGAAATPTTSAPDTETVNALPQPAFTISKGIKSGSATTYKNVGDQVTFEYTVTNSGNETLTSPITVSDDQIAGTTTCGPMPIAPGDSVTCELVWTATQTAINAGEITNIGTASSPDVPTDATDTFTTSAVQEPGLAVEKTSTGGTFEFPGGVVSYDYVITNTGNTEIDTALLTVTDSRIASVSCPAGGGILEPLRINPAASYTCTATYNVTLEDVQLGEVTNLASVSDGTTTSPQVSETVPAGADPSLSLTKTALSGADFSAVGDRIEFEFVVQNTSVTPPGASFTEEIIINDPDIGAPFVCFTPLLPDTFSSGEIDSCTAEYFVTQDDLDAGEVVNQAIATTIFAPLSPNPITVVSAPSTETVPADPAPGLTVTKSVTGGATDPKVGESIQYTILTENTGNQTLTQVKASDPKIPVLTCTVDDGSGTQVPAPANVALEPGDVLTCVGDYVMTQTDIDNGQVVNVAAASGNDPRGNNVPTTGTNTFTSVDPPLPELTVVKSVTPTPGAGDPAFGSVGETVTFVVEVTNTGNITVDSISVADSVAATNAATPANCPVGTLAPGASSSACTFEVVMTQAEIDAGSFENTATATGAPRSGGSVTGTQTINVEGPDAEPAFAISKTPDVSDFTMVGDEIVYTFVVGNAGNVTLFDQPEITDDKIGTFDCGTIPVTGLLPLETLTCTATYAVTQNDVDAGFVTNIASVDSDDVPAPAEATATVNGTRTPGVSMTKTPSITADAAVDDIITYTYTVTNTGNTRLFDVAVTDAQTSAAGTNPLAIAGDSLTEDNGETGNSTDSGANGSWDVLAPGDVVEFTASYTVTQADVDLAAPLTNDASVSATGPPGTTPPSDTATVSVPVQDTDPQLEAVKLVSSSTGSEAGDTVNFSITIANTGNVTLDAPVLVDTLTRTDGTPLTLTNGPDWDLADADTLGKLDVGEVWTYTASYVLEQGDIDAGGVANQVLATSAGPNGEGATDRSGNSLPGGEDSPTVFSVPATPSIEGEKTITSTTVAEGELVTFQITATNTGNVTLTGVTAATADDTLLRADNTPLTLTSGPSFQSSTEGSTAGTLIPGETATYVASYRLVQEDIDAGGINNAAIVRGSPPLGGPVSDATDNGDDGDGNTEDDVTTLVIPADPELSVSKDLAAGEPGNYDTLDQEIMFEFTVVNEGNVTLSGPFTVADALIEGQGNAVSCPVATLLPDEDVVCTGSYFVTQDDLDAGSFTNAASASDGTTTSPEDTITVPALQNPSMAVEKVAGDVPPASFDEGLDITYTYTVTNDGNVTLTDDITISDNLIDTVTCDALPAGGLLPTQTLECTGIYTVTADDVLLFSVTNLASSTSGATTSPLVSETIPNEATPSLVITKTAEAGATFAEVGDEITYTFDVTNDGTQAFSAEILIFDDKIPGGDTGLSCPLPAGDSTLSVGQTISCDFIYAVTQDDLDAGEVVNEAYAQTNFGDPNNPTPVTSAPTTETVAADEQPGLTLDKTSAPNPAGPLNSTVTYTLVVTNTGNQTLNFVSVEDERLPGLVCEAPSLLRGDALTCNADYIVTQEDIDAGGITNTASATAQNPSGAPVGPIEAVEVTGVPAAAPGLTVKKTSSPTVLGAVGSFVTFNFEVENTGTTTLQNISVDDALDTGPACVIPRLAPTEIDAVTCSFMLEVTQDMIDDGFVTNDVTVGATDLLDNPTTGTDSITVPGPARVPSLEATKIATSTGQAVDDTVTYLLSVENTGNVTLSPPRITDVMRRNNNTDTGLTTPFVLVSGDANSDDMLDVDETWVYSATHVITQSDVNATGFTNTATVEADGPAGTGTVDDMSDNGNDSDGNTEDDLTPFNITAEPQITTTKVVTGTPGTMAGESVSWTITARNTGNVDISGVEISDSLTRADGTLLPPPPITTAPASTDLDVGEELVWVLTHELSQEDIDAGGLSNSATVSGEGPNGEPVEDISADEDPFDGDIESDPTVLTIPAAPGLDVIKTLKTPGVRQGEVIVFTITAENTGNVTLSGVTVADQLTRIGGGTLTVDSVAFVSGDKGSSAGTIQVGETVTYEAFYTLQLADVDAGGVSNSAIVTGTTPLGATLADTSNNGDPNDGNDLDDPTVAAIAPAPANTLTKTAGEPVVLFPTVYQVTFTMEVTNTGNVTQSGYQISDDLADFAGSAQIVTDDPFDITVRVWGFTGGAANTAYDGSSVIDTISGDASLAPGETGTVEIDVVYQVDAGTATGSNVASVTSDDLPTPAPSNEASVPLPDTDGDGIPDSLEGCSPLAGNDRDGDGICDAEDFDPTGYFYCEDDGRLLPGGSISVTGPAGTQTGVGSSNNIRIVQDGATSQFVFFVTRPGTYTLNATYPSLGVPSTTRTTLGTLDATTLLPANPASLGASEVGNTNVLSDFTAAGNPFYTTFTFAPGDPFIINNNLPLENCQGIPDILATKQADRESAVFGETVNFTLSFTNNTSNTVTNMNLVDLLPAGMLYTPNSAVVDGAPLEPTVTGLRLTWAGLTITPTQTINITLAARVVANGSYGELTNRAFMTDAAGNQLSNTATATVRIEPEHVFDCSDIIGKVYDDRNQNGYQDQGEPGLPGVRLATVRGYLITTDEYGRYHVPCAELPKDIGSNFTLKLDTRTLPTGYRVTTENPRVIRVTAGKFAKLNFGAAQSNVVDIDLTARAFDAEGKPVDALGKGLDQLVRKIAVTPSVVRLSYILRDEDPKTAQARLKLVEAMIREKWRGGGRYKLNIERTVKRTAKGAGQ